MTGKKHLRFLDSVLQARRIPPVLLSGQRQDPTCWQQREDKGEEPGWAGEPGSETRQEPLIPDQ